MPTLAHEGNPKLDDITIAEGEVLSEAVLTIDFIFFGPQVGSPPLEITPFIASSSCPNVFTWPEGRDIMPFNYNDVQSGGAITTFTDQIQEHLQDQNNWLDLAIESKPHCCGCTTKPFYMVDIPQMSFATDQVFPVHDIVSWRCTIKEVQDTPYAGICAWVKDGSTFDNFTGYVLAANYELGITNFMRYKNQSLCEEGILLGTINTVPTTLNDTLTISVRTDPGAASVGDTIWELIAEVKNSAGTHLGNSPIDLQVHDILLDAEYTFNGRGETFVVNERVKPYIAYVYYQADGTPVYSTKQNILIDEVTQIPSGIIKGHRHNYANVGYVCLGNHPLGQDTGTIIGGQNQIFFGGTLTFAAASAFYGHRLNLDSYSFGPGTVA